MVMSTELLSKTPVIQLKGRLFTLTVLQLSTVDVEMMMTQLLVLIQQAPKLLSEASIVLDCTLLEGQTFDLSTFCMMLCQHGLMPVAIQTPDPTHQAAAKSLGLGLLNASAAQDKALMDIALDPVAVTSRYASPMTKRMTTPIRSGQQVVNRQGDLVITASVSHGAEVLSEGDIHVYGALRGKALAGMGGDRSARIYCQQLDAELVAIAGFYLLKEEMPVFKTPCHIYLQDEQVKIEAL